MMEVARIERQARELEESLQIVESQIAELEMFKITLDSIMKAKDKEMLSTIGGRVYLKTKIEDIEKLFVEVGAGVIVKKTPSDTQNILKEQIHRLKEARLQIKSQLEEYYQYLENFMNEIEEE